MPFEGQNPNTVIEIWGDGFRVLRAFSTQILLMFTTGFITWNGGLSGSIRLAIKAPSFGILIGRSGAVRQWSGSR